LDPHYFNIRIGIYAPSQVSLRKCDKKTGYQAITASLEDVALDTADSEFNVLKGLPEQYKGHCFSHTN